MRKMTRFIAISATILMLSGAALAQEFTVETNKTRHLKLRGNASSVVIGDPRVADVAFHDENLILITGRSFGTTNLLVIDRDDNIIYSGDVVVTSNTSNLVSVNRAGNSNTYDCAPRCRSVLAIGDDSNYFGIVAGQSQTLQDIADDAN